jgi:mannose-6-phosphate isomerase-like protein (cupin superfamily)
VKLVHQDLFGGRGKVTVELELERQPPAFECVLRCTLAAGGSVGTHVQEECDEVLVVLAGKGSATVDGKRVALRPGTVVPLALGQTLALKNGSKTQALRYLIIKARKL